METTDLTWVDATETAALVASGRVSPVEAVRAAINRMERIDGTINAVIHRRDERALAEAAAMSVGEAPFAGVPIVLKDLLAHSAGDPHHCGARFLKQLGWTETVDSAFVRRIRKAGFVLVGRANVPEFGTMATTEPEVYGPTRNPWDTGRTVGGSSGGSAAAVAAGMVPVAHGNDAGGSLRIPASMTGLVALKPTRGRVSVAPHFGEVWGGAAIDGPMSRTVRDAAGLLDAMSGPEPGDPYVAPPLAGTLVAEVGRDPGNLRIGVLDHTILGDPPPTHPEVAAAAQGAAKLLVGLGHCVEAAFPEAMADPLFLMTYVSFLSIHNANEVRYWEDRIGRELTPDDLEERTWEMIAPWRDAPATDYLATMEWMHSFSRRVASWWVDDGYDLLLSPIANDIPSPIGYLSDPVEGMERHMNLGQFTAQFNITGQPVIALPLHQTPDGLPVGVQLVAAAGREDLLVRIASQIEAAHPWADRRPSL